jgi:hypothetical protein
MTADRYLRGVLTVIAVALVATAVHFWLPRLLPGPAQAQIPAAKYDVTVPKAWGKFLSYSSGNVVLEGSDGVYRIVDVEGRPPEFPKIKYQFRFN